MVSMDSVPRCGADLVVDILEWDFKKELVPGEFDVVFCCPP